MDRWHALLALVAGHPRENGTAALHRTALLLGDALEAGGLDARYAPFEAHPLGPVLHGMLALLAGVLFIHALQRRRPGLALLVGALPGLLLALELGFGVPAAGRLGATPEAHVGAVVAPAREPRARLVLVAHYDTRTDLLPRPAWRGAAAGAAGAGGLALGLAALLALRRGAGGRHTRGLAALSAGLSAGLAFLVLAGGLFAPHRSPGAVDDGGSVAVLLRTAATLAGAGPADRLRFLEVEVVLLAGEELVGEGSRRFAAERFPGAPDLPTSALVVHQAGAGPGLAVGGTGRGPGPPLLRALGEAAAALGIELSAKGAEPGLAPRALRRRGVPAVALVGAPATDRVHRPGDLPERLDRAGLDRTLRLVLETLCRLDRRLAGEGAQAAPGASAGGGGGSVCYGPLR